MNPSASKIIVPTNNPSPQIDAMAGGNKSYTPGKGASKDGQQLTTLTAYYDKLHFDTVTMQASSKQPVFDTPMDMQCFDVETDEFCISSKVPKNSQTENPHALKVFSSLNCLGVQANQAFPGDIEMQKVAIRNGIRYAGISTDIRKWTKTDEGRRQGVALKIGGEATIYADNDLPPGMLVELIIPDPEKRKSSMTLKKGYIPADKVLLEVAPYNPSTLSTRVMAVLRNYGANEETFKKGMDPKVRTTNMWVNLSECCWNSALTSWAVITKSLISSGVIPSIAVSSVGMYSLSRVANGVTGTPAILAVLKAFGSLPSTGTESTGGISQNFALSKSGREAFQALKKDIIGKLYYDGRIKQNAFDYNTTTRGWDGRDARGGKLRMSDPMGAAVYNQLNHFIELVAALNGAIREDNSWLVGKISHGAKAGSKADIFK